jgi:methionyl-tRNA synthetase
MVQPIMPEASAKLLDVVGSDANARQFSDAVATQAVAAGTDLPAPTPIFPRYVETEGDATN